MNPQLQELLMMMNATPMMPKDQASPLDIGQIDPYGAQPNVVGARSYDSANGGTPNATPQMAPSPGMLPQSQNPQAMSGFYAEDEAQAYTPNAPQIDPQMLQQLMQMMMQQQ